MPLSISIEYAKKSNIYAKRDRMNASCSQKSQNYTQLLK